METWKIIEGFENYSVSDLGNVKNNKTGRIKNVNANKDGYIRVSLNINNKKHTQLVHILIANAFIANPDEKLSVDHIDNNKCNNKLHNLRRATTRENNQNRGIRTDNTSGCKGVSWSKRADKWKATISIDGIQIHLGLFTNIKDAKQARITRANEAFGVFTNSCEKII